MCFLCASAQPGRQHLPAVRAKHCLGQGLCSYRLHGRQQGDKHMAGQVGYPTFTTLLTTAFSLHLLWRPDLLLHAPTQYGPVWNHDVAHARLEPPGAHCTLMCFPSGVAIFQMHFAGNLQRFDFQAAVWAHSLTLLQVLSNIVNDCPHSLRLIHGRQPRVNSVGCPWGEWFASCLDGPIRSAWAVLRRTATAALLPPCVHHVEVVRAIHIFTYIRTYLHTYIHAYMHTCIHAYMHTCIHAYMHTCMHAYMHARIHAYMHTCIHAYMHTCIHNHTCIHTYMHNHTCIHTYIHNHTCIHTYIHTSIHTYICI